MQRLLLGTFLLLLLAPATWAQTPSPVTFGGQIRGRSEVDARDFNSDTSPADVHLLRTRLNVSVEPDDRVEAFVQIQDSRRFGAGDPTLARGTMDPSAGQLDVHQAYFKVSGLFGTSLSLKAGRQELAYGNQRLIGTVGWSNVGRTFDAGVLAYEGARASVDVFAARLVGTPVEGAGSQNLFGLYSTWQVAEEQTLDLFALLDNDTNELNGKDGTPVDRLIRFTPGFMLRGTLSSLSYRLEAAYQTGKKAASEGAERLEIGASLLSAYASYTVGTAREVTFGAGYTRLSGDDAPGDDVLGHFNTLFATNHKFYGFMDYFPAASATGLQDVHVKTAVGLSEQVTVAADFHHFAQAETTPDRPLQTLGQELDLTATYRFAEPVTFGIGLSGFLPGDAMEAVQGSSEPAYWGYLTSVINF